MDVASTSISGIWRRQIPGGGDVHHEPDPPADSRWQRGEVVDALYFAESEETAWAEWYRVLAESGLPPTQALPRDLWRWEIALPKVADLSTPEKLATVGLQLPTPARSQWPPFQRVGEALWEEGWPALVAPSAARQVGESPLHLPRCADRPRDYADAAAADPRGAAAGASGDAGP